MKIHFVLFDNGINNEFEEAHQKGLHRGFDLGWSYKGRYYRQMVRDMLNDKDFLKSGEATLKRLLKGGISGARRPQN